MGPNADALALRPSGSVVRQGWHGLDAPASPQAALLIRQLRLEVRQNLGIKPLHSDTDQRSATAGDLSAGLLNPD
jgi:hypothetical protein